MSDRTYLFLVMFTVEKMVGEGLSGWGHFFFFYSCSVIVLLRVMSSSSFVSFNFVAAHDFVSAASVRHHCSHTRDGAVGRTALRCTSPLTIKQKSKWQRRRMANVGRVDRGGDVPTCVHSRKVQSLSSLRQADSLGSLFLPPFKKSLDYILQVGSTF